MQANIEIIGVINDEKFTVRGEGQVDPDDGVAEVTLNYSSIPQDWNPLNYSDPLVLLAGYQERDEGMNFMTMTDKGYDVESTIDFGGGLSLRKTANVRFQGDRLIAVYSLSGAARIDDITGIEPYREYLLPARNGELMGVGMAEWNTPDGTVDALVSSRYQFDEPADTLSRPQVRGFEVEGEFSEDERKFEAKYDTYVRPLVGTRREAFESLESKA